MIARLLGRTGVTAGRDFIVEDLARLGASPENEICIAAPGISRRHARIARERDQYWLEDVGATNGTFLNGGRIAREQLRHLDVITLGRSADLIFLFRASETAPPATERVRQVVLELLDGPDAGAVVEVAKGELTLGRATICNVVLASPAVSKMHARLERTADQVILQDLQSANGTFVNGQRIELTVLNTGDVLSFGRVRTVRISIEGVAGTAPGDISAPRMPPAFDQEWKTRFEWLPEEIEQIEAMRRGAVELASLRESKAEPAKPAPSPAARVRPKPGTPAPTGLPGREPPPVKPAAPPTRQAGPPVPPPAESSATPSAAAPPPIAPITATPSVEKPVTPSVLTPWTPAASPDARSAIVRSSENVSSARVPVIRGARLVGAGLSIELGLGTFTVGRGIGCEVRLEDRQVSRAHAKIAIDPKAVTVEDLETVNGTIVNGREARERQRLGTGDSLRFGASELTIEVLSA